MTKEKSSIHVNHRDRIKEKFLQQGLSGFAEHEILEYALFFAIPYSDTNPLAHKLISKFGSFSKVLNASIESLMEVKGIGKHTAIFIKSLPAFFNAYSKSESKNVVSIKTYDQGILYAKLLFSGLTDESFFVVCIDPKGNVIATKEVKGAQQKVNVSIREITTFAIKEKCIKIFVAHNHPNVSSKPSNEDIVFTYKLLNSCYLNDIDLIDHVIISKFETFSMAHDSMLHILKSMVVEHFTSNCTSIVSKKVTTQTPSETSTYSISQLREIIEE